MSQKMSQKLRADVYINVIPINERVLRVVVWLNGITFIL